MIGDIHRERGYSQRPEIFTETGDIHRERGYSQRSGIFTEIGDVNSDWYIHEVP
jgi:hypothetical protein